MAEALIEQAKRRVLPAAEVQLDYSDHDGRISILEPLVGQSGELMLSLLSVEAQDQVDKQRDELITQIEGKLVQTTKTEPLFTIRWCLA